MTEELRKKYLHLYETANKISLFKPWDDYNEADRFVYMRNEEKENIFFSFIKESVGKCCIACYIGEEDYLCARFRLTQKNKKNEPVFMLQNALICFWDDKPEPDTTGCDPMDELGFKPDADGSWLHFDRYEIGYVPVPLDESEVELLTDAFENLYMMLHEIYENGLDPEFDKGKTLVRGYEPKSKIYLTCPFEIDMPVGVMLLSVATVHENDLIRTIRSMPKNDYIAEFDWSYTDIIFIDDDGRKIFPKMMFSIDHKSGNTLFNEMVSPMFDQSEVAMEALTDIIEKHGKPSEVLVCDEELKSILDDFCNKIDVELTFTESLKALNDIRKDFLSKIM